MVDGGLLMDQNKQPLFSRARRESVIGQQDEEILHAGFLYELLDLLARGGKRGLT